MSELELKAQHKRISTRLYMDMMYYKAKANALESELNSLKQAISVTPLNSNYETYQANAGLIAENKRLQNELSALKLVYAMACEKDKAAGDE